MPAALWQHVRVQTGTTELIRSFSRAHARSVRRSLRARSQPRPCDAMQPVQVGNYELRRLRRSDGASWTASMRANEDRMRPWWPPVADWHAATDAAAFADHYLAWRRRERSGRGIILVVSGPDGVLGEVTTWNLTPGGATGENGIWLYPRVPRPVFLRLWASYFDNLFGNVGLQRVTSPISVGNRGPLRLAHAVGAREVAVMPGVGPDDAQGAMRLFSLSRQEWLDHRRGLYAAHQWPQVTANLPVLSRVGSDSAPARG